MRAQAERGIKLGESRIIASPHSEHLYQKILSARDSEWRTGC